VGPDVYKETGILRFALTEKQEKAFKERAEEREDVEWWSAEKCHAFAPGSHYLPGIFIRSGITVHANLYLTGVRAFEAGESLDLRFNKGQILVCQKPKYWKEASSVIGKGYLAMSEREDRCYLGSTYERDYMTEQPCLGTATDLILKQIGKFIPAIGAFKVEGCHADIRVSNRKSYHPIAQKLDENLFVLTAMGSRGLLYHSYLGKALAETMMEEVLV
jgi:glycine/D-amino acid oxidase-like deaminating enzyme